MSGDSNEGTAPDRKMYMIVSDPPDGHTPWAAGFYGGFGKAKTEQLIPEGYFHRHMYEADKHKKLIVIEGDL